MNWPIYRKLEFRGHHSIRIWETSGCYTDDAYQAKYDIHEWKIAREWRPPHACGRLEGSRKIAPFRVAGPSQLSQPLSRNHIDRSTVYDASWPFVQTAVIQVACRSAVL